MTKTSRQILFITFDVIGPRIGGSAIRVLGLARALAEIGYSVTVAAPRVEKGYPRQAFPVREFDLARPRKILQPLLANASTVILPVHGLARLPLLKKATIPLIFDLYDPVVFELMESAPTELRAHLHLLERVLRRGDFFLCASERQRDFWLGAFAAHGRVADQQVPSLIGVVPFGIDPNPVEPAASGRPNLAATIPEVAQAEKVIVWPGGLWDWTDPEIVLHAMRLLAPRRPGIHLVFFAGRNPTDGHVDSATKTKAHALAREFQLESRSVHFIEDYIPSEQRGRYLTECDVAVSTHCATLESHFAYRTRLLDCVWSGLPMVCTEGDVLSDLVVRRGMGTAVPAGDSHALAHALEQMVTEPAFAARCRARITESRHLFVWHEAVQPLVRFCAEPRVTHLVTPWIDRWSLVESAWQVCKTHGLRETFRRLQQHRRGK